MAPERAMLNGTAPGPLVPKPIAAATRRGRGVHGALLRHAMGVLDAEGGAHHGHDGELDQRG